MTFEGIPDSIPMAEYLALQRALGFESLDEVCKMELLSDGVYVEMQARSVDGGLVLDEVAGEIVRHRIFIPVRG